MRAALTLIVLSTLLALQGVSAQDCVPTTSVTNDEMLVLEAPRNGQLDYLVVDICQMSCTFAMFTYIEVNDIEGLQRGDHIHDDSCGGMIRSDSIWI